MYSVSFCRHLLFVIKFSLLRFSLAVFFLSFTTNGSCPSLWRPHHTNVIQTVQKLPPCEGRRNVVSVQTKKTGLVNTLVASTSRFSPRPTEKLAAYYLHWNSYIYFLTSMSALFCAYCIFQNLYLSVYHSFIFYCYKEKGGKKERKKKRKKSTAKQIALLGVIYRLGSIPSSTASSISSISVPAHYQGREIHKYTGEPVILMAVLWAGFMQDELSESVLCSRRKKTYVRIPGTLAILQCTLEL